LINRPNDFLPAAVPPTTASPANHISSYLNFKNSLEFHKHNHPSETMPPITPAQGNPKPYETLNLLNPNQNQPTETMSHTQAKAILNPESSNPNQHQPSETMPHTHPT